MKGAELMLSTQLARLVDESAAGTADRATVLACIEAAPEKANLLHMLGLQALAGGDTKRAVILLEKATGSRAEDTAFRNNLGVTLLAAGRTAEAAVCLREAARLGGDAVAPRGNLGVARYALGEFDAAAESLSQACAEVHPLPAFRIMLARVWIEQDRIGEAECLLRATIAADLECMDAVLALGRVLAAKGQWTEATRCYDRTLDAAPDRLDALCALAGTIDDDRVEELSRRLDGISVPPADPDAQYEMQFALATLARLRRDVASEAEHYRRALEYRPDATEAWVNLAKLLLLAGDYAAGWPAFEWRWRQKQSVLQARGFARPVWRGEALDGAAILLHAEQGLGDTIQFARYATLVAERGGQVVLEVPEALVRLMSSLKGVHQIVARGEAIPPVAWQCPLVSLPLAFRTTVDSIPASSPYLSAAPEEVQAWRERLPIRLEPRKIRVGIAWAGAPYHYNDRRRSMPAAELSPLGGIAGVLIVSLQKHLSAGVGALPFNHIDLGAELADFATTAAVIENLDLVIAVDTAVAHLAGALAKPVWIMLPFAGEYRWLTDRDDSPWYATARLFRQPRPGDWASVVRRVCEELRCYAADRRCE